MCDWKKGGTTNNLFDGVELNPAYHYPTSSLRTVERPDQRSTSLPLGPGITSSNTTVDCAPISSSELIDTE